MENWASSIFFHIFLWALVAAGVIWVYVKALDNSKKEKGTRWRGEE
ncbi:MAG: hypothetical protein HKP49_10405 [Maribacter sp.]|nr:hypothetical protein [Maribacter sp.]